MTSEDLLQFFLARGREARIKKNEVQLRICPKCGNAKWNFEANVDQNLYNCWVCRAGKGDSLQGFLQREFNLSVTLSRTGRKKHVEFIQPEGEEKVLLVDPPPSLLPYLAQRGLEAPEWGRYGVRFCSGPEWINHRKNPLHLRLLLPVTDYWSFERAGYVARAVVGQYPKYYYTGSEKVIAGYRDRKSQVHVLCEGVFDGIKISQAGYNAAILMGKQNEFLKEFAARVPKHHLIVIALDGDAQEDAERLRWEILPIHERCAMLNLPPHLDPGSLSPSVIYHAVERLSIHA
jgi:hypothetical protein